MEKMGLEDPEEECERIFRVADLDDNGSLEFKEWCTAAMDKTKMLKRPRLWAAFKMLDVDGSGEIGWKEVRDILVADATGANDQMFKDMITEVDKDGDGCINFEEFEKLMQEVIGDHEGLPELKGATLGDVGEDEDEEKLTEDEDLSSIREDQED